VAAFILTRPLGETMGDLIDKPVGNGGLEFSRPVASATLATIIVLLIMSFPQRPVTSATGTGTAIRANCP
jgi:uncharacterized membrane-anchored protein